MLYIQNLLNEFANNKKIKILSAIELIKIEDRDWVSLYQNSLKPIVIDNFFISGRLHKNLCPIDKIGIFIDASRAFGTGDHSTTTGCIEAMIRLSDLKFDNIIDIGTGTGILIFAAENIWPSANIVACDIEEVAIEIARSNSEFNNSKVEFYENLSDKILIPPFKNRKFDLIISNILAGPLIELASQIRGLATEKAYVVLSGFLDYQISEVRSSFEKSSFEFKEVSYKAIWVVLILKVKGN